MKKLAMVTGGARGIGLATARRLRDEGYRVVLADLDGDLAQSEAKALGGIGVALDVRDAEAFGAVVRRLEADEGPVAVLVNNAGIMPVGGFLEQTLAMDARQIDINVHGVIAGIRAVLPAMRARREGHIVNIASVAGKVGCPDIAVYSAAKHAVIGLTEAVRHEVMEEGVRLSYVCPAFVRTELIAGAPGPRWPPPASPDDVGRTVVRALRTGKVDLYVPRIARLSAILPALLPRSIYEPVGKAFGLAQMFTGVDAAARQRYRDRVSAS